MFAAFYMSNKYLTKMLKMCHKNAAQSNHHIFAISVIKPRQFHFKAFLGNHGQYDYPKLGDSKVTLDNLR